MKFADRALHKNIYKGIEKAGFTHCLPVQKQTFEQTLDNHKDVCVQSQTGTGKTAAYLISIFQLLLTHDSYKKKKALIVAPTRELAEQIHQATRDFSVNLKVRSVAIYGGVSKKSQIDGLRRGAEIVIACPGRLLDLLGEGRIDLSHVEVFVLDEADRMCDMGFLPDVRRIVKKLPNRRQSLFFSATMPKEARELANTILRRPVTVQIGMAAPAALLIWVMGNVPPGLPFEKTAIGWIVNSLEPLGRLWGLDGEMITALVFTLPAKEIVVPALSMTYGLQSSLVESEQILAIISQRWSPLTSYTFLVFYMLYLPCFVTVWAVWKETRSSKWLVLSLIVSLVTAVVITTLVYMVGLALGY